MDNITEKIKYVGNYNGADIYNVYSHHPGELISLLDTIECMNYKRFVIVFQPRVHTNQAILTDEIDLIKRIGIPLLMGKHEVLGNPHEALLSYFEPFDIIEEKLRTSAKAEEAIYTIGAGNVYTIGTNLLS